MSELNWDPLFAAAATARTAAWAPYSHFQVGAAILCDDGSLVKGCNVENATYGATVCAERNALGAMVVAGRTPVAVAIVVDSARFTPPCGICRQVLLEFGAVTMPVRSYHPDGTFEEWALGDLLPHAFTRSFL